MFIHQVTCQHLLSLPVDVHGRVLPKRPKDLSRNVQSLAVRLVEEGVVRHYEVLSLDVIANGLATLVDLNTMYKDKR
jgi:glycerone phosphate O-acyltransferase